MVGLPASRYQAAGKGAGVPAAHRDRGRRIPGQPVAHLYHRFGRQWHVEVSGREVRPGSKCRFARRGEAVSGMRIGDRTRRPGRQDHHLQKRPGNRPQEEAPLHERQVRGRHRRGHRQDQRQAAHPLRAALRDGLQRLEAAPRGRQVRRVRGDRYQRPAEDGRAAGPVDGIAVRSHRDAEPLRADARQHAPARGPAAGRAQLLHQGHARLLEAQHPENLGRARHRIAGRRSARGFDPHPG